MPGRLTPGDRRLFLVAGGVFVALIAISAVLTGGASNATELATTYSAGSRGAKAAFVFLDESGYRVERFEQAHRELPNGEGATLIIADPESAPTIEDRAAVRRFIEDGGRVIATGVSGSLFLPERHVQADGVSGITWGRIPAVSPSAITRSAAAITMAPQAYWEPGTTALPLYADDNPRVVRYRFGPGEVMWWASATPLTNAGIREPGNLEFFLASLGSPATRILWDESAHGHVRTASTSLIRSPLTALAAQVSLFALAILFTFSRRSGPLVPPPVERRLSPLEFVRTLGSLYQRAGAAPVAVDIAYQRFRFALAVRLGMAGNTSAADLERASRERWRLDAQFGDVLRSCETLDPRMTASEALRLNRALYDYAAAVELYSKTTEDLKVKLRIEN